MPPYDSWEGTITLAMAGAAASAAMPASGALTGQQQAAPQRRAGRANAAGGQLGGDAALQRRDRAPMRPARPASRVQSCMPRLRVGAGRERAAARPLRRARLRAGSDPRRRSRRDARRAACGTRQAVGASTHRRPAPSARCGGSRPPRRASPRPRARGAPRAAWSSAAGGGARRQIAAISPRLFAARAEPPPAMSRPAARQRRTCTRTGHRACIADAMAAACVNGRGGGEFLASAQRKKRAVGRARAQRSAPEPLEAAVSRVAPPPLALRARSAGRPLPRLC